MLEENDLTIEPIKNIEATSLSSVKILWPKIGNDINFSANDSSTVTLIEFAGREILFCSDIEKTAQSRLLELYPDLRPDVVVVPHHGSTNTLWPEFLEKLNADILVYSCDQSLYEKHQADKKDKDSKSFYTAADGAITIEIEKDGEIKVNTFKEREEKK